MANSIHLPDDDGKRARLILSMIKRATTVVQEMRVACGRFLRKDGTELIFVNALVFYNYNLKEAKEF
jgi:hypothetical protein